MESLLLPDSWHDILYDMRHSNIEHLSVECEFSAILKHGFNRTDIKPNNYDNVQKRRLVTVINCQLPFCGDPNWKSPPNMFYYHGTEPKLIQMRENHVEVNFISIL